jgi:hypothetical protein
MDALLVQLDAKFLQLLPSIIIRVFQIANVILVLELIKSNAVTTDKNVTGHRWHLHAQLTLTVPPTKPTVIHVYQKLLVKLVTLPALMLVQHAIQPRPMDLHVALVLQAVPLPQLKSWTSVLQPQIVPKKAMPALVLQNVIQPWLLMDVVLERDVPLTISTKMNVSKKKPVEQVTSNVLTTDKSATGQRWPLAAQVTLAVPQTQKTWTLAYLQLNVVLLILIQWPALMLDQHVIQPRPTNQPNAPRISPAVPLPLLISWTSAFHPPIATRLLKL